MRGRRMRRAQRKSDRYGAATVVLLLLLVAAFIYAFQSLGIYDILFKPVFNNGTASPTISPAVSASASGTPASASATASGTAVPAGTKLTEEIKMNSVTLYGVQLGVFTKLENAQATSDNFRKDGSAGYLLKEDTLYRVVDSVYYTENDAKAVRDLFRKGTSPDACVIRVQASGINWKVTATREQIDAIRGSISAMQGQIVALINAQKAAQQGQGTASDLKAAVTVAAQKFRDASASMMKAVGSTNSAMIVKLNECLTESADNLEKLAQTDASDTTAYMSGIKYNIIDILLKLQSKIMG